MKFNQTIWWNNNYFLFRCGNCDWFWLLVTLIWNGGVGVWNTCIWMENNKLSCCCMISKWRRNCSHIQISFISCVISSYSYFSDVLVDLEKLLNFNKSLFYPIFPKITLTLNASPHQLEIPVDVRLQLLLLTNQPSTKSRDLLHSHRHTPSPKERRSFSSTFRSIHPSSSSSKQAVCDSARWYSVVARARPCNDVLISREAAVTAVVLLRLCFLFDIAGRFFW